MPRSFLACVIVPLIAGAGASARPASFLPLGGDSQGVVSGMCMDGTLLVGAAPSAAVGDFVPVIFRLDGTYEIIEQNPGSALDCTSDGSRIIGNRFPSPFLPFLRPCMWVGPSRTPVTFAIPSQPFSFFGACAGISDDGQVAAVYRYGQSEATAFRGFMDGSLLPLEAVDDHYAYAASADGSLIAGRHVAAPVSTFATLWNPVTGAATDLIDPAGLIDHGEPAAFSPDGAWIVGSASFGGGAAVGAFRATIAGDVHLIHAPAFSARAARASNGGRVVVGTDDEFGAFVWDASHGVRPLRDVLAGQGVDMTGWQLHSAVDVTADGTKICGNASLDGATLVPFLATIPPPPCEGDADGDGFVGLADIAKVILNWDDSGVAGGRGDIDADGQVGMHDVALVLMHFGEACE